MLTAFQLGWICSDAIAQLRGDKQQAIYAAAVPLPLFPVQSNFYAGVNAWLAAHEHRGNYLLESYFREYPEHGCVRRA